MRRLIALATLAAVLLVPSPVSAQSRGLFVKPTATADAAGCYGLDVWNGDQLVKTLPADDGDQTLSVACAHNRWSALLSNGRLIFDWNESGYDTRGLYGTYTAYVWSSDGAPEGTRTIWSWHTDDFWVSNGAGCGATIGLGPVVGPTAYLRTSCYFKGPSRWTMHATGGLGSNTFALPGDNPGPAWRTGHLVVYAAYADRKRGRELFVSDGSRRGSHVLKDIWPGGNSSDPHDFVSHGSYATFSAYDGTGLARWRTNGTAHGTHTIQPSGT